MERNISELQGQLQRVREDLRLTLSDVNRKLEAEFQLEGRITRHPMLAALTAFGLGYTLGRSPQHVAVLMALAVGALGGLSLPEVGRGPAANLRF